MTEYLTDLLSKLDALFVFGIVAQGAFMARFAVQWVASERAGRSVVPESFWWLSLAGGTGLLIYFIARGEPVGILAQLPNSFIYIRNLMLIRKERTQAATATVAADAVTPPTPAAAPARGEPPAD